jgi:hypothetical protein
MQTRPTNTSETEHRRPAGGAQLSYAIFRWESAVIVSATLLLIVFLPDPFAGRVPFWRWWFWLILGIIAEGLIIATSLNDPATQAQVLSETNQPQLAPELIASDVYRDKVVQAVEKYDRMQLLVQHTRDRALSAYLAEMVDAIHGALSSLYDLACNLDRIRGDVSLHSDLNAARDEIARLDKQLQDEQDPDARVELSEVRDAKQTEWVRAERLHRAVARAESQLDAALHTMRDIYARMQLIDAQDIYSERARRLRQDITDLARALTGTLETLESASQAGEAPKSTASATHTDQVPPSASRRT